MKVTLWGTRGSLPNAGPETVRYGGNTSCVEVTGPDGTLLVLDAGTGVRRLGAALNGHPQRVDILLTHLHMDHIQGLGFFQPLYEQNLDVHIWGPPSSSMDLYARLGRYLSPPLFPVRLRDLPCRLTLHDVVPGEFRVGCFRVSAEVVCHPGRTLGYRISENGATMAYLPDHEPALCHDDGIGGDPDWISGFRLADRADALIHDAQYTAAEYPEHLGWGHSSIDQALDFAGAVDARKLVTFHHDPAHTDDALDAIVEDALSHRARPPFEVVCGTEGLSFDV